MDQTTQSQDHLLLKTRVDARHRHRFAYQQGRIRARYLFIITGLTRYHVFVNLLITMQKARKNNGLLLDFLLNLMVVDTLSCKVSTHIFRVFRAFRGPSICYFTHHD